MVVEGDAVLVAVELSASRSQATTVTLSSHQNTATSGTDFTAGPYTVSIPAGQTRGTVSIQTTQDSVLEDGDEDFDVSITGASPATTVGSRGRATITIEDDEYTVDLGSPTYLVDENAGVYRQPVTLSRALRKDVLIDFTYTDWSATSFVHYTPVHASAHGQPPLRIEAGQRNAVLEIPIHDDTNFGQNRLFQITAVNPELPDGESNDSTQIIIRNVDDIVVPSSITAVAGRTLRVAVERIPRVDTVPVTFVVELTDVAHAAEFGAGPHRFTIPAGRLGGSVDIPVTADADTAVETISLRVNHERTGTLLASPTATIYPLSNVVPTVSIAADSAQVVEGGMANFTVTASPAPPVDMDVQVRYFVNGGAFLDMEEEVQPAEEVAVTIPANGRTGSVAIQTTVDPSNASGVIHAVLLDRHDTPNGSASYPYRVRGKNSVASDGTPIGGSAASIKVTDGPDMNLPRVKLLRLSPRTVEEGTDLDFYLNVNFAPESDLPVNLSIREGPGTFAPGGDYVDAHIWTATIPAGERGVAFSIPTVDDGVEEPNAIARVRIESGTGYTVRASCRIGVLTDVGCNFGIGLVAERRLARRCRTDECLRGVLGRALPTEPLRGHGSGSTVRGRPALWGGEADHLVGGQCEQTEHEMAGDFCRTAHAYMAGAELVLEPGIGPLDGGTDAVSDGSGIGMAGSAPGPGLSVPGLLEGLVPSGVGVDERDVAEPFADLVYLARIIGGVHEVVEVHDPPCGHGGQGDGSLGVMDGGRSEDGAERHAAVGRVDMELVSPPSLQHAPGVPLCPPVAELREVVEHRAQAHAVRLALETGRRLRPLLAPAGATGPALRHLDLRLCNRRLPTLDGCRVPRHMADERLTEHIGHQRLVHPLCQTRGRELGKCPRKGCLARNIPDTGPAAQPPQRRVRPEPVDQVPRRRKVPNGLGQKGSRQGAAVLRRTTRTAPRRTEKALHTDKIKRRNKTTVRPEQRTHLLRQRREKLPLKSTPEIR